MTVMLLVRAGLASATLTSCRAESVFGILTDSVNGGVVIG